MRKNTVVIGRSVFLLILLPLVIGFLVCCGGGGGGGGGSPSTVTDLTGFWTGTWTSGNEGGGGGDFATVLLQQGSGISGPAGLTGSPCFGLGNITGVVSGNSFNASFQSANPQASVQMVGAVIGHRMSETYVVTQGGACQYDVGTFVATLQSFTPTPTSTFTPTGTPSPTPTPSA
jgi:hypothetical protein